MKKYALIICIIGIFLLIQPVSAQTWERTKRLTWNSFHSWYPVIATDSNNHLHVAWEDNCSGNWEIYYKHSMDGGTTWSSTKRLTWNSGSSKNPSIAVDSSNNVHIVWEDDTTGDYEIYYKKGIQ